LPPALKIMYIELPNMPLYSCKIKQAAKGGSLYSVTNKE